VFLTEYCVLSTKTSATAAFLPLVLLLSDLIRIPGHVPETVHERSAKFTKWEIGAKPFLDLGTGDRLCVLGMANREIQRLVHRTCPRVPRS
jgi:hypothetical protein